MRLERLRAESAGGVYLVRDSDDTARYIFKPSDEEPGAENDQKLVESARREGVAPGHGYLREVAAYALDHGGRAGVPMTRVVQIDGRVGSLQEFVANVGSMDDFGPSALSVDQVHRVAALDVRLANLDRHAGNLLLTGESDREIVPIDHGFALPSIASLGEVFFEWHMWPQARAPLSAATLQYIEDLDFADDLGALREHGIALEPAALATLYVTTTLLKRAAAAGRSFFDMAELLTRPRLDAPSVVERILAAAVRDPAPIDTFLRLLDEAIETGSVRETREIDCDAKTSARLAQLVLSPSIAARTSLSLQRAG